MAEHRGGSGNFAEDREKASEAGVKADSTAAELFKTILNVHPEAGKKGGGKNSMAAGRKSGDSYSD